MVSIKGVGAYQGAVARCVRGDSPLQMLTAPVSWFVCKRCCRGEAGRASVKHKKHVRGARVKRGGSGYTWRRDWEGCSKIRGDREGAVTAHSSQSLSAQAKSTSVSRATQPISPGGWIGGEGNLGSAEDFRSEVCSRKRGGEDGSLGSLCRFDLGRGGGCAGFFIAPSNR